MKEIYEVLNSDDKLLSAHAGVIIDLEKEFRDGNLSKEEYTEVLEDIQRTVSISEGANSVALQGLLITGVANILKVL